MIPAIVNELNKGIADERGVRLEVYRWETDAYPGFHSLGPQGQIDTCLRIDDCGILRHNFAGTNFLTGYSE